MGQRQLLWPIIGLSPNSAWLASVPVGPGLDERAATVNSDAIVITFVLMLVRIVLAMQAG